MAGIGFDSFEYSYYTRVRRLREGVNVRVRNSPEVECASDPITLMAVFQGIMPDIFLLGRTIPTIKDAQQGPPTFNRSNASDTRTFNIIPARRVMPFLRRTS